MSGGSDTCCNIRRVRGWERLGAWVDDSIGTDSEAKTIADARLALPYMDPFWRGGEREGIVEDRMARMYQMLNFNFYIYEA